MSSKETKRKALQTKTNNKDIKDEKVENVEVELNAEIPVAQVETENKSLTIKVTRDKEGRIVFEGKGLNKRIAGTDSVVAEVARQIGEEIVKSNLI